MNSQQIEKLMNAPVIHSTSKKWKLVETHISYVLLGSKYVFKIKKNIRYSFLDFSTLTKRKYYCERELTLNKRLTTGIYLKVVPVMEHKKSITINGTEGKIIDYAIMMKRMKDEKQMNLMLRANLVTRKHISALAAVLRDFHHNTSIIKNKFRRSDFTARFNDIRSVKGFVQENLGKDAAKIIRDAVRMSDLFLQKNKNLFIRRSAEGFIKDCHGDLHSRNIFLYQKPVIFDCIEFNDEFRQTDILDELAFFCMDLEAEGFYGLSKAFTGFYFKNASKEFGKTEQLIFIYYKCYRANVRAKVNALRAMQAPGAEKNKNLQDVSKYLNLTNNYLDQLSTL